MTLGPQSKIYISDSDIVSTSMLLALKQIDLTMCIERQPCALHIAVIDPNYIHKILNNYISSCLSTYLCAKFELYLTHFSKEF